MHGLPGDGLALLAGASLPFAFAPFAWYPLAILAPALLFLLWQGVSPLRAFTRGWLFGLGQFGIGVSWIHISIYQFGGVTLPFAVAATVLFVAFLALFPAVLGYITVRLVANNQNISLLTLLPGGWVLLEWVRGWLFTGFPWLNIGTSQIDAPLAGLAPLLGAYGVSLAVAFSAGLVALIILANGRMKLAALVALCALWLTSIVLDNVQWTAPIGKPLQVTLLQGNITQSIKWQPEQLMPTLDMYRQLTRTQWQSDIIVWPETAVPAFYHQVTGFIDALHGEAQSHGASVIMGIASVDRHRERYYNSMLALGEDRAFYHKRHLVPFGEYLPLAPVLNPVLDFLEIPMSDFSSGPTRQRLLRVAGHPVNVSICYEDAFGEEVIRDLPQAALLINASNDSWFGDSFAPHQHLQIARLRAVETGRYLLRATNTGISAVIGPQGRIIAKSPQFQVHVLQAQVQARQGATPYVHWGNFPAIIAAALLVLFALAFC